MKSLASIFHVIALLTTLNVQAGTVDPVSPFGKSPVSAELVETFIDPAMLDMEIIGGRVDIDLEKKVLRLALQPAMPYCPENMACIQVMPQVEIFELPIVFFKRTTCGDRIVARRDNRPADGALETISLVDYTFALCKIGFDHPIQGVFKTVTPNSIYDGETLRTRSDFSADRWY